MMTTTYGPKEKLYTSAYSSLFDCFVRIDHAHQDNRGEWIFTCISETHGIICRHLFRKCELNDFVI